MDWSRFSSCSSLSDVLAVASSLSPSELLQYIEESLRIVIGANFTGMAEPETSPLCVEDVSSLSFQLIHPSPSAKCLPYLHLARLLLDSPSGAALPGHALLSFHLVCIWQKMLVEPSFQLKEKADEAISRISVEEMSTDERVVFYLERFYLHLVFYEFDRARDALTRASTEASLFVKLTGKLGKRTRFQQNDIAQLVLETEGGAGDAEAKAENDLPPDVANQDDTVLDQIRLESSSPCGPLSAPQSAVLLATCYMELHTEYVDELVAEKVNAYLDKILADRRGWSIQSSALLLRSKLEKNSKRRVERACQQCEAICNLQMKVVDTTVDEEQRVRFVLCSGLMPWWQSRALHAEILSSLGCFSEALLIYERLSLWDDVVVCYRRMGQLEKAEHVIRRLLEDRPNDSDLWCALGDICQSDDYYHTAVRVSGDHSAKARKALGMSAIHRNDYKTAYDNFARSTELQPIQLGVWFHAGYSAWKMSCWKEAATAYHRCVSLEPEHFEAWNNLAAVYIRMNQKERARRILQEALKYNYEHVNVWENYLLLCVDTHQLGEGLLALHRIIEGGKIFDDDEAIEALVTMSIEIGSKKEMSEALAKMSSKQSLSAKAWRAYALLKKPEDEGNADQWDVYLNILDKSHRMLTSKPDWYKTESTCLNALRSAIYAANERLRAADLGINTQQGRSRARMALRQMISPLDRDPSYIRNEEIEEEVKAMREILGSL